MARSGSSDENGTAARRASGPPGAAGPRAIAAVLALGALVSVFWINWPVDPAPAPVVVLYSARHPWVLRDLPCPSERCRYAEIEPIAASGCAVLPPAHTVILTGHAAPPTYLGLPAGVAAAAVVCFRPELVAIDMERGFSAPLFEALATLGQRPLVVGDASLPLHGLRFGARFFEAGDAVARAAAITSMDGAQVKRWHLDPDRIRAVLADGAR